MILCPNILIGRKAGGGSFSVSEAHVERLRKYIINQKEHHKKVSLKNGLLDLLKRNDITLDNDSLPDFF